MGPAELRALMEFLVARVALAGAGAHGERTIAFAAPDEDEMAAAGLDASLCAAVRGAPWWEEMAAEVVETPDFCAADEPAETVLEFARDVVREYLRKRVPL
jgi:hypothetical protein